VAPRDFFGSTNDTVFRLLKVVALFLRVVFEVVAGGGIEPPTQGFSVLCSTN
jgi:hypothetical protein